MGSLSSILNMAVRSLNAATGAIQVTNNNIANANTAGYTREIAVTTQLPEMDMGEYSLGNGVDFSGYQSVRSELLQGQVRQEMSAQSGASAGLSSLETVETSLGEASSSSNIGTEITALFSRISALSTNPTSSSQRESVLNAAQNLATSLNTVASAITSQENSLNSQVSDDVSQINTLTKQIADLNTSIQKRCSTTGVADGGVLQDQQDELMQKLSALTSVNVVNSTDGVQITTGDGTVLVSGAHSYSLSAAVGSNGKTSVLDSSGADITDSISSGDLGGAITTRDQTLTGLQSQLDHLAYDLGTAFNAAQKQGYDQNGATGTDLFTVGSSSTGAAASIKVAITDPAKIAVSSDGSSGSSGNIANFTAIQTTKLSSGKTPTDAYSALVYSVGSAVSSADSESSAASSALTQLNDQLQSVSGVSIDEEAANLIQYQQSYTAAAHVISVIQSLYSTLVDAVS